jgi:hypothetical protein
MILYHSLVRVIDVTEESVSPLGKGTLISFALSPRLIHLATITRELHDYGDYVIVNDPAAVHARGIPRATWCNSFADYSSRNRAGDRVNDDLQRAEDGNGAPNRAEGAR